MKKIFNEVRRLVEFEKDLKRLSKKFRTLETDLETFIQNQLNLYHKLRIDNRGILQISGLGISYPKIFKAKKFACRSLKGKGVASGIRVIYAYFEQEDVIELAEIYYEGEKENEDRNRLLRNYRDRTVKNKDQD
jgi:mRNA-degrading endonuclease YafQ of YafQ-DinJ toxin-antitoxin module